MIELTWRRADVSRYIDYKREGYRLTTRTDQQDKRAPRFKFTKREGVNTRVVTEIYICEKIPSGSEIIDIPSCQTLVIKNAATLLAIRWSIIRNDGRDVAHRDDGPSMIFPNAHPDTITRWCVYGLDITKEVTAWLAEMDLPPFYEWNDGHKALFKLRFGGVGYQP